MATPVKKEPAEDLASPRPRVPDCRQSSSSSSVSVIDLSDDDSSSSSDSGSEDSGEAPSKRRRIRAVVPLGFLAPLPLAISRAREDSFSPSPPPESAVQPPLATATANAQNSKQFWKAGDYNGVSVSSDRALSSGGIDHVRVHPKFLHSNATSHKWALGAFAELLDNSLDEVSNGATYVNIDMLKNKKDGNIMLLVEDNGGGMDPDKIRQCMSLGYSAKSKMANTIGQYGNGFKTSTMRLGADVIVFSRCSSKHGKNPTQSIGMLSYTFLRSTGMEDIVVPMLDYERKGEWNQLKWSTTSDWSKNVETIIRWSPFSSEDDLLRQFNMMGNHGTRIVIYNLWEDDQGFLELDFYADPHDIQLRGVNRDEKNIQMAKRFPNSRHYLTYKHSLRSYASILYLRLPPNFRIILRGKDVEHHNVVNDMMLSQEITYRPQAGADGIPRDNMAAIVTIGFVKDAVHHIDVQGFNVYHKNRLIKPFWRLWNPAASHGRGVIGVLEANFVEPAHDKQGFERTTVLARLEGRLVQMQKTYWHTNCHRIGYSNVNNKANNVSTSKDPSLLGNSPHMPNTKSASHATKNGRNNISDKSSVPANQGKDNSSGGKGVARRNASESSSIFVEPLAGNNVQASQSMEKNGRNNISDKASVPANQGKDNSSGGKGLDRRNASESSSLFVEPLDGNNVQASQSTEKNGRNNISDKSLVPANQGKDNSSGGKGVARRNASESCSLFVEPLAGNNVQASQSMENLNGSIHKTSSKEVLSEKDGTGVSPPHANLHSTDDTEDKDDDMELLRQENSELRERLKKLENEVLCELQHDLDSEKERCTVLERQLQESLQKIKQMTKDQENLVGILAEERKQRESDENNLRQKLKDASITIQELLNKANDDWGSFLI
ncbi:hypothetical protein SAY86_010103 [Trapa natans]|uniref:Morc S5 domain-containing protein n=1 Tax=Trapa natans TaxID=22666 RepID=A0AAN7KS16_TRANT|nr:hypothetical protein SAY86_010103 [Trapa natans]